MPNIIFYGLRYRKDNVDQLGKIVSVLGTPDLMDYLTKYGIEPTPEVQRIVTKYSMRGGQKRPWLSFLPKSCAVPSAEAIDLLDKLLMYDHDARLTAQQAMQHPFFDPVRDRVTKEVQSRPMTTTNSTYAAV